MSAAAAAGLPPNPYISFLNSLPHNSPLRQLVNVDGSEEMFTKRAAEFMNGMSSFDPSQALQHLHQHREHPHRQRTSMSSNRSLLSRSPSPANSFDESMASSKPHDDVIMNGKDGKLEQEMDEDEEEAEERAVALRAAVAKRLHEDELQGDDDDMAKDMSKPTSVINSPSHGDEREHKRTRLARGDEEEDVSEDDSEEKDKIDNKVQRLLNSVNANVTRQFLEACSLKNGYSAEKMLANAESSCDPLMSPGSGHDSQHSRPQSRYGDDYDMDDDQSRDNESEIHNNNNSIISSGGEDLMKMSGSSKKRKGGGVEGLAARLDLSQNDAAAVLLLQIQQRQQQQHLHNRDDKAELDMRRAKEEMDFLHRRHDDENPSSQSENESGDHRKLVYVTVKNKLFGKFNYGYFLVIEPCQES